MLAEAMGWVAKRAIGDIPPDGKDYWAGRYWDRASAENHEVLRGDFVKQKATLGDYFAKFAGDADEIYEFACGTGDFTRLLATRTSAHVTALDVSETGLAFTREKTDPARVDLVLGDFWADNGLRQADAVVCVDAIHHLGDVRAVLERLATFAKPGGVVIGNVLVGENFHEFGRKRYGTVKHTVNTAQFMAAGLLSAASGGPRASSSYRTQLNASPFVLSLLSEIFDDVLAVSLDPFFMAFAVRV